MNIDNLEYAQLRSQGIRYLEKMIGEGWSDFNTHDPGITILEQVCYAMTDLAYRNSFDLPDLLAEGGKDWAKEFYRPSEVLTTQPVTITDMRKLAMDVEGVKNAWVECVDEPAVPLYYHPGKKELSTQEEPPASQPVKLKGLYRVWVEKSDLADIDGSKVQYDVLHRLHAHRPLCEDFERVQVLSDFPVKVSARIEIGPVEDVESLLVDIYEQLANYISPRVPFYTLNEMLAKGKRIDEIFDGPMLEHGFIESSSIENLDRHEAIYSSDLIHEIMSVAGVRAVRHIGIGSGESGQWESWELKLPQSDSKFIPLAPKLDVDGCEIILQRDQLEVSIDNEAVSKAYALRLKSSDLFNVLTESERDILPPTGRQRNVGNYYSILNQFPLAYGVGPAGLPSSASSQRKAQARQLKAYLMFFDQLLANLFAQLEHARDLFSFDDGGTKSYFSTMIDDPKLELETIRRQDNDAHLEKLQSITETAIQQDKPGQRRNRFLNHLLARFAEHFTDYSLLLHSEQQQGEETPSERLIKDKESFLRNYPKVSTARGTAFDYLNANESSNISGLQERMRLKLGLSEADEEVFYIVEHILLRSMEGDQKQAVPFLASTRSRDPYSLQLSCIIAKWPKRFQSPAFCRLIEQTLRDETPAHLTVYTHWLDKEEMTIFETVYQDWLTKLNNRGTT